MSKVLIIATNFWPEPTGIAVYTTDLAELLYGQGHSVSVLTSLPHYPWWKVPEKYSHLVEGINTHNGVSVIRAKHLIPPRMDAIMRMTFEGSLWWNLRRVSKNLSSNDFDVVISVIPTLAAGISGRKIARKLDIPFGVIVQDLSGVGARQSGLHGGALISKVAQAVEKSVLNAAKSVVVVSPAMQEVVKSLGVEEFRIRKIFNYSARQIVSFDREKARRQFGWSTHDFIVIYTGNMGAKQYLQSVVKAASFIATKPGIKIYLVGHGNQESKLKAICFGKSNIGVLPAVEDSDYSTLLSAADLLLINERSTQLEMSLPSKLTSYLFSQRPVVAAVPKNGATWQFLQGIAELVDAGKPELLAQAIEELSRNAEKRSQLASNGLQFAKTHLDPVIGRKKYLDWVESLIESKHG